MTRGTIDGREINALTINVDEAVTTYTFDNGYKICLRPGRTRVTLPGNTFPFVVPVACGISVKASRTSFCVPANRGCMP